MSTHYQACNGARRAESTRRREKRKRSYTGTPPAEEKELKTNREHLRELRHLPDPETWEEVQTQMDQLKESDWQYLNDQRCCWKELSRNYWIQQGHQQRTRAMLRAMGTISGPAGPSVVLELHNRHSQRARSPLLYQRLERTPYEDRSSSMARTTGWTPERTWTAQWETTRTPASKDWPGKNWEKNWKRSTKSSERGEESYKRRRSDGNNGKWTRESKERR